MPDTIDRVTDAEARARERFEEDMARLREEEARQARIAESLRGYDPEAPVNCVDCGEIVSAERLRLQPHTRRCVPCAADVERAYRREVPPA